jgi:hypothetical protein
MVNQNLFKLKFSLYIFLMKVLLLLVLSLFIVILNSKFTSKHRNKFMKKNQIRKSLLKHANSLRHGIRAAAH